MSHSEILLFFNTALLTVISALFLILGYFLKDLHRDFKRLIERVNRLYQDILSYEQSEEILKRQIQNMEYRILKLENMLARLQRRMEILYRPKLKKTFKSKPSSNSEEIENWNLNPTEDLQKNTHSEKEMNPKIDTKIENRQALESENMDKTIQLKSPFTKPLFDK